MTILKKSNESFAFYVSRIKYACLRRILPSLREQYRLETLTGPFNCWEKLKSYQISLLRDIGLSPHHKLLDIGCGPLSGGLNFIKYLEKGNYVGVDIRFAPLHEAYRLIAKHELSHKNPIILHSETFGKYELNGQKFDYIWASQVMYHLNTQQTTELIELVTTFLKPTGYFIFDIITESLWSKIPEGSTWQDFDFHLKKFNYYNDLAGIYNLQGHIHGVLEDYGYPERQGLRKNKVLVFRK